MNKKIIAVICVVILMASVFAACGKKPETVKIGGSDVIPVTNEKGELVTDKDGKYAYYVTNEKGEKVTAEDGSPNINYKENIGNTPIIYNNKMIVTLDESLAKFTFNIPDGWKANGGNGRLYKDGTEMKCCISVAKAAEVSGENTLAAYIDQLNVANNEMATKINAGEFKNSNLAKATMSNEKTTYLGCEAVILRYTIYGNNGEIVNHAEDIYFVGSDDVIYNVGYICENGVGYDANFNFVSWANNNVTMAYPVAKK